MKTSRHKAQEEGKITPYRSDIIGDVDDLPLLDGGGGAFIISGGVKRGRIDSKKH